MANHKHDNSHKILLAPIEQTLTQNNRQGQGMALASCTQNQNLCKNWNQEAVCEQMARGRNLRRLISPGFLPSVDFGLDWFAPAMKLSKRLLATVASVDHNVLCVWLNRH